jgi:hypothetical protein
MTSFLRILTLSFTLGQGAALGLIFGVISDFWWKADGFITNIIIPQRFTITGTIDRTDRIYVLLDTNQPKLQSASHFH